MISKDTYVSVFLLLFSGFLLWASHQISDPGYGGLPPDQWPKGVTYLLTGLCLMYLARSLLDAQPDKSDSSPDVAAWLRHYFNPIVCFLIYFAFLATLPFFGTLVGGSLLVFFLLSFLGGISTGKLLLHAMIALISVGLMWALFTYGLRVILPRGTLIPGI